LVSESTFRHCGDWVKPGDPMDVFVKGKSATIVLREILAIPSLGHEVPRQEVRRSPRVPVMLPLRYHEVAKDVVMPEELLGRVLDIGYHGVLAELQKPLPHFEEVAMAFDLPLVGK